MRGGEYKCRVVKMHLKLRDKQHLKNHINIEIDIDIDILLYINLMVTTNQKSVIDTNIKKNRNPNMTLKIVIKSQEKRTKEEKNTFKNNPKTIDKMAMRVYISIITLNVN